jgi:hypothetical protein
LAKKQPQELPEPSIERITHNVRSMRDDRVERGVELSRPMHCDSCGLEKPSAGSSLYGEYRLCNDCLLEFTIALASGRADTVADFMTRTVDAAGLYPPVLSDERDRSAMRSPLQGRDKLRPSNEPA